MTKEEEYKAILAIGEQIHALVQESIKTHGVRVTVAGLVACSAALIGTLDRDPLARALAAWNRCFASVYDANLFAPIDTAGEA